MNRTVILILFLIIACHTGIALALENQAAQQPAVKAEETEQGDDTAAETAPAQAEAENRPETPAKHYPTEEIFFDLKHLNLFDYGIGFVFGFDPLMYGFSGMLGYRHLNTFTGFPGPEGGTRAALDIFIDAGVTIASLDGDSTVAGFAALTMACNILWFKSLESGNFDRTGNGIFIGARVEGAYSKEGFTAGYGPAIGWTMLHYNTEKKKFRTTNVMLFFYPPTMVLGISASTNF